MAVAVLNVIASVGANPGSMSYTVSAGADRILVAGYYGEGTDAGAVTMTYGGQSMTSVVESTVSSGTTFLRAQLFILLDAGIAAASNTTLAAGNTQGSHVLSACSFTGANQATPTNVDSANANASTPNPVTGCDIVAGDNSAVVGGSAVGQSATASYSAPLDADEAFNTAGGTMAGATGASPIAAAQTVNVLCTWSGQNRACVAGIGIAPVGEGASLSVTEAVETMTSATGVLVTADLT